MAICEPRHIESSAHSESTTTGGAVIKLHDVAWKTSSSSSRSIVSASTEATCVPTDVSECSDDDDFFDNSVIVVETIESSDDEGDETEDKERNNSTRQPTSKQPIKVVDLLSDPVEPVVVKDEVKKPLSLPNMSTQAKKTGGLRKGDLGGKGKEKSSGVSQKKGTAVAPGKSQQRCVAAAESEYNAKRRAMARKRKPAPEPGPERTVYDLFVPPAPTARTVKKRKRKRKRKRERKTAAGAVVGMVAGGVTLGPLGVVLGAAVGGMCTRQAAKKAEKRSQRRREQQAFRDNAMSRALQWDLNDSAVFV